MKESHLYSCKNCGHIRLLDNPDQTTICQQCKEPYKVSKAIILHESHGFINFYGEIKSLEEHCLMMNVFEVGGWRMNNDVDEADLYLESYIKWDGCSHVTFADNGYIHLCGKEYWKRHIELMANMYEYASNNIKRFDNSEK